MEYNFTFEREASFDAMMWVEGDFYMNRMFKRIYYKPCTRYISKNTN